MFVAYDKDGNRIYADECPKGIECFCPVCNEPLRVRRGSVNKPHFAHLADSNCTYAFDKDSKSEWHIRMQEYFPKAEREVRFEDSLSHEVHIADIFVQSANTVIEFQHSSIDEDEFLSRTKFHLSNGRKIVWVFDESKENTQEGEQGRFRQDFDVASIWPYDSLQYRWMRRPRKALLTGPDLISFASAYSICVYLGIEGDVVHRIIEQKCDYTYVTFSLHNIEMCSGMNVDQFFKSEDYWMNQSPLREQLEEDRKRIREKKRAWEEELLKQMILSNLHR